MNRERVHWKDLFNKNVDIRNTQNVKIQKWAIFCYWQFFWCSLSELPGTFPRHSISCTQEQRKCVFTCNCLFMGLGICGSVCINPCQTNPFFTLHVFWMIYMWLFLLTNSFAIWCEWLYAQYITSGRQHLCVALSPPPLFLLFLLHSSSSA